MPNKPLTLCSYPGCSALVMGGRCEKHRKQDNKKYETERGTSAARGYDANWNKARAYYLNRHPVCEMCEKNGMVTPATLVHHIKAIKDGGEILDYGNMMALCNDCHESIHGKDRFKRRID